MTQVTIREGAVTGPPSASVCAIQPPPDTVASAFCFHSKILSHGMQVKLFAEGCGQCVQVRESQSQ